MKKSLYAIFFTALLVALIPPMQQKAAKPAEAEHPGGRVVNGEQIPDSDFEIDANGVLVKYNGMEEVVTVPDGVTQIGEAVFYNNQSIQRILLPDTVTEIGNFAFEYCNNLIAVEGGNLVQIRVGAFLQSSIREIDLSKTKIIEASAFERCLMLEEANLEAVEILGNEAFNGCRNLRTVTGLEQLGEIGFAVFLHTQLWEDYWKDETKGDLWIVNGILLCGHHCTGTVAIPDNVKKIADVAFWNPDGIESKLEKVIIPNSVTEIGTGAFSSCRALTTVRIEDSVMHIGLWAFGGCLKLTDIRLSNALTSIDGVFEYCTSLERLTLPASVKKVGEAAFWHCPKLKILTIPPQLEEFADNVNEVNYTVPLAQTIYVTDIAEAKKLEGTIKECGTKVAELKLTEEKVVLCTGSKFALR
ncbi:MAG: leucine-rich repeat domain-containing protein, partial [Lachnospiraceae bacterium]|nr:leucine-rich repeat domain-containing protein [Lachnospiraceae bacterium]